MEPVVTPRAALPPPAGPPPRCPNLWSLARAALSAPDLASVPVPVTLHEPLTDLQQKAEDLEYAGELLDGASALEPGSLDRLTAVAAFAVSGYAGQHRTGRPFLSAVGETYELIRPDLGWRFVAEKVGARPHTVRARADGASGWTLDAECELTVSLAGTTIHMTAATHVRVTLPDGGAYTWGRVPTMLHDGLRGPRAMWLQHAGKLTVTCEATGASAVLEVGDKGRSRSRRVRGRVTLSDGSDASISLEGAWDEGLAAIHEASSPPRCVPLWACASGDGGDERHALTAWTVSLNAAPADWRSSTRAPPPASTPPPPPLTDSRWRADARALEEGRWADAASAAAAAAANARAAAAAITDHTPSWFRLVTPGVRPGRDRLVYEYGGAYWGAREARALAARGG